MVNFKNYDGGLYCIGNGKIAAYLRRGEIVSLFGPPYSSPSALCFVYKDDLILPLPAKRIRNSAIWTCDIYEKDIHIATTTDFASFDGTPLIIKKIDAEYKFSMNLSFISGIRAGKTVINNGLYLDCVYAECRHLFAGNDIYNLGMYPLPFEQYYQILVYGNCDIKSSDSDLEITFLKGKSEIIFIGGPSYGECVINTEDFIKNGTDKIFDETLIGWEKFFAKISFENIIPQNAYRYTDVVETLKSTAINIITQQSSQGGVLAGHNYHLGYVRDQYGVSRALLSMGLFDNAKKILEFYYNVFLANGYYKNAQGLGVENLFHRGENDEVEITAYMIIQAFDYYNASGDKKFIDKIYPMLKWSLDSQITCISDNMLPFNGDETYIAGGILPRCAINDGSAESTMLFILGTGLLLDYIKDNKLENPEKCSIIEDTLKSIINHYNENFIRDNRLITNNPTRKCNSKRFTFGVCQYCESEKWPNVYFGEVECTPNGMFSCPECMVNKKNIDYIKNETIYEIESVNLMPIYFNFNLIDNRIIEKVIEKTIKDRFETVNGIYKNPTSDLCVGYDYGLLLINAHKINSDFDKPLIDALLNILDECGSWSEFYVNSKPVGTRYRPWESGINAEALILSSISNK